MYEEIGILTIFAVPVLSLIVCFFLLVKKDKEIRKAEFLSVKMELNLRLDWDLCSMLLTNKPIRELIYRMESFDGTEEEAREIAESREFEIFAVIVERLLSSSLNVKKGDYLSCCDFIELFIRNPIFLQTIYSHEEEYPQLVEILEKRRNIE